MKEDQSGELKFVEINPRFGGGTYFASLAGVNFMKAILDLINKNPIEIKKPNLIKIMRYYREVIV
jgi:carbamoylphosphate synthase large subunit